MDCLCTEDSADFHSSPTVRSMLSRIFAIATARGRARRVKMTAVRSEHAQQACTGVSAREVENDVEFLASSEALNMVDK